MIFAIPDCAILVPFDCQFVIVHSYAAICNGHHLKASALMVMGNKNFSRLKFFGVPVFGEPGEGSKLQPAEVLSLG